MFVKAFFHIGIKFLAQLHKLAGLSRPVALHIQWTLNDKLLTANAYLEFADWLKDVRKQLENDIKSKGRYVKVMSGFSSFSQSANSK